MDFQQVPYGAKWVFVGNNTKVEVKGMGTWKLVMRSGQTLFLHDVLFAPQIHRNLISVL